MEIGIKGVSVLSPARKPLVSMDMVTDSSDSRPERCAVLSLTGRDLLDLTEKETERDHLTLSWVREESRQSKSLVSSLRVNERDFDFIQSLASDRKKDIDRRSHRPEWHVSEVLSTGDCPKTIRRFKLIQKEPKPTSGLLMTGRRKKCMWKKGNPPFRNSIGDLQQLHQGKSGHPFHYSFLFDFGFIL